MSRLARLSTFVLLLSLLFANAGPGPTQAGIGWQARVDPGLLAAASSGDVEFLVYLKEQADLSGALSLKTKDEKGAYVYQKLAEVARRTQGPVVAALASLGVAYRPYWVANMIWVRSDDHVLQALAQRPEVAHLYANPAVHLDELAQAPLPSNVSPQPGAPQAVEWNIAKVGAPQVWAAGYRGQGVVIGGQDTGYDWSHPALKDQYRGWNGSTVDHNYNWHDAIHADNSHTAPGNACGYNAAQPCDDEGHGTHTMGIMVGDDGGGDQIGMAPAARWIGCRDMEDGWGSPASYSECYQWFIAPTDLNGQNPRPDLAPDVINNSWGCPPDEGCADPNVLLTVVENVRAAGILTVHSAGNSGSTCSSVNTPAAIYDASFTVGNTNSSDQISNNSSRGPVTVDGSGRLKPDISAPGTNIRSSIPGGYSSLSGTSMAGPHVAGLAALLISAQPQLAGQVDELEAIIEQSAVPLTSSQTCGGVSGSSIPNNTYGWGRIDAYAALKIVPPGLDLHKSASASRIAPGQTLTYTIQITNLNPISLTHHVVLTDVVLSTVTFISASTPYTKTGDLIQWDYANLNANETQEVELVVRVPITATGTILNADYGVKSDEIPIPVTGPPVSTEIRRMRFLYIPSLKK